MLAAMLLRPNLLSQVEANWKQGHLSLWVCLHRLMCFLAPVETEDSQLWARKSLDWSVLLTLIEGEANLGCIVRLPVFSPDFLLNTQIAIIAFLLLTTKHRWGRVYSDFSVMCCKDLLDEWVQTYKTWPQPPAVIWAFAFLILPDCSQVPPRSTCMQGVGQAEAESCRHCRSIFILLMCRTRRCSF